AVWCWAAGSLWAITRLARKPDLIGWGVLSFSVYSLLMTAYPQPVVFHTYILGAYGLYLAFRKGRSEPYEMGRFLAYSLSALMVGGVLALPVYIDLANQYAESARIAPDPSFFTAVLPKFSAWIEVVRFFVRCTFPELFGNPVAPGFPFSYDGLSATTPVVFFSIIALLAVYRRTWGWWLAILILGVFAFVHPLYVLGIKYLGFNLSRTSPLGSITLPLTIIVAHGVDALVKRRSPGQLSKQVSVAVICVLVILVIGICFGFHQAISIRWSLVPVILGMTGLLALQQRKTRPALLIAALIMVLATSSFPLMLHQDPKKIATTSPLVERLRLNLPGDTRFAVAAPGISALPPNLNAELDLASIHSYNGLSPLRYHRLIEALGGEVTTYGRLNVSISPDYDSVLFWMSNIGLMLSPTRLSHKNLEYLGQESGINLYKVISRMGDSIQVNHGVPNITQNDLILEDPRILPRHPVSKLLDQGDVLEFEVTPGPPSVLVLSRKFHRDWQARVLVGSGWTFAQTTAVNEVFQGVLIPNDSRRVRLEFKPWARHAWIAHVFWLLLLVVSGWTLWRKKFDGKEGKLVVE
ncbi:MAG: hypothetical protein ACRESZ_08235, partial [Methylococcales bacterium]